MASGLWHVKKKSVSAAGAIDALHLTNINSLAPCRIIAAVFALSSLRVATGYAVS